MLLAPRPPINLVAGWQYLFDRGYRREIRDDWEVQPLWVTVAQTIAGVCSVVFPVIVFALLAFVVVERLL